MKPLKLVNFKGKRYRFVESPVFDKPEFNVHNTSNPTHRCRQCVCCSKREDLTTILQDEVDNELHTELSKHAELNPKSGYSCYKGTWIHDTKAERVRIATFLLEQA